MFLENFSCLDDVLNEFEITEQDLDGKEVVFAWYGYGFYDGDSFVLARDTTAGSLYEVNASHCSCFGLEYQWDPEPTTKEALLHRIENGRLGSDDHSGGGHFKDQLLEVLAQL